MPVREIHSPLLDQNVESSFPVRKAHNSGKNHLANVKDYYASLGHDKAQSIIDQITAAYESSGGPPAGGFGFGPQHLGVGPPAGYPPMMPPPPGMARPPFPPGGPGFPPMMPPPPGMGPPGIPGAMPPFPPNANMPRPPFPPQNPPTGPPGNASSPPPPGNFNGPPPNFNGPPLNFNGAPPANFGGPPPPAGQGPSIHPDRLKMLGGER
ncbi:U1 small nuclear ribonucleoprotein C [Paramarasmius palmivorus]|uniref:U1 small nuclear ribonucleoprotein C n=1 Tax=Paramarasmius palmivorus TaxID=297713 RepID=A0AAW0E5C7_9AGAR